MDAKKHKEIEEAIDTVFVFYRYPLSFASLIIKVKELCKYNELEIRSVIMKMCDSDKLKLNDRFRVYK